MKKKLLVLSMVLALVAVLVMPMAALAETTTVTGTVATVPTLTSVTASIGDEDTTPTITLVGTGFIDGETTVSLTGTVGITPSAVTHTVGTTEMTSVFTIGDEALSGARNVLVTVAGITSVEAVTFTVNGYMTVTAPGTGMALGYLTAGTTETATITGGTVASNWENAWSVLASDLTSVNGKTTNLGQMNTLADGTGTVLANLFNISLTSTTEDLTSSATGITYTPKPTTLPFFISQVVASDAAAGAYTITISFIGSGN